MMKRFFVILVSCLWLAVPLSAQSNKLIRELESKRGALQKQIAESESILKDTKKDVGSQLNSLAALTGQIEERKRYILAINNDVDAIERELNSLERQLRALEKDLKEKKKKYEASVQYLYKNKSIEEKLMFIFSAKNLGQTYRRMRYVREYATYQRLQGEEILKKQEQIRKKKAERQQVKAAKENLLKEREGEKVKLDNKGIDIQGKPGAQARAIFDGKVAAVFQLNGLFNVLIRHGNYISVYCNLSSASVKTGDTVKTKQSIGQVFSDGMDNGRTVLHFQLRREKEKLNPEPWLNR